MTLTVHVYRQRLTRQWRWRARAANGRNVANGGESYRNLDDCLDAVFSVFPPLLHPQHPARLVVEGHEALNRVLR